MIQFSWRALVIGNSRLHWAEFHDQTLLKLWHSPHFASQAEASYYLKDLGSPRPLYFASVVPSQTHLWQPHSSRPAIALGDIPLQNLYSTLGIDRALAAYGAAEVYGCPCLVIDAGTALTFTALDGDRAFWGGAILPGLTLQLQSLYNQTASLPAVTLPSSLPMRWAQTTENAIMSGILHTAIAGLRAFIDDWRQAFPQGRILLTGGDGDYLLTYLSQMGHDSQVSLDPDLSFWGMRSIVLSL